MYFRMLAESLSSMPEYTKESHESPKWYERKKCKSCKKFGITCRNVKPLDKACINYTKK